MFSKITLICINEFCIYKREYFREVEYAVVQYNRNCNFFPEPTCCGQPAFTCSKSTIKTPEQCVKSVPC